MRKSRVCFKNLELCPLPLEQKQKTAFVLIPFNEEFRGFYEKIKAALNALGWTCSRADEKFDTPEIICTVCKNIQEASLVIADLTGKNPNVFLEVGLAFGLEKHVVLLSQNIDDIPFDTRTFRTIIYNPADFSNLGVQLSSLIGSIKSLIIPEVAEPLETIFESNYNLRKSNYIIPPSKPILELFIGSTNDATQWLPVNKENLTLMHAVPDDFNILNVNPRRNYFEFQSEEKDVFLEIFNDGFFHIKLPIVPYIDKNEESKDVYYLSWIMSNIAAILFFVLRLMEKKSFRSQQTVKIELHGVGGLKVIHFITQIPFGRLPISSFSSRDDSFSYQESLDGSYQSAFQLLKTLYREICLDLGVIDLQEVDIKNCIIELVSRLRSLHTQYSSAGLREIPTREIIGSSE
jgi:hypothetical protein